MTTYIRHLGQDKTEQDRSPGSTRRPDKTTYIRHFGQDKTEQDTGEGKT